MKIKPEQLAGHLKRKLNYVYIISGDEPLQVSECADQVRKKAKDENYIERVIYHIDNTFDWRDFIEAAHSLSLFSDKKIIELRIPNGKISDAGKKSLIHYMKTLSPDNLLILITNRLESKTQNSKWFQALNNAGVFIPIWPIEHEKLPDWIAARLKIDGFYATPEALMVLTERIEGNLLAASQEIEKLKLTAKDRKIDEDLVRESVSDSARYDVFHLADAALDGNVKSSIRILGSLKSEGVEPPVVLWSLTREIRVLSYISRQLARGVNIEVALTQSAKILGFSPYLLKRRQLLIRKAIERHTEKNFRSMLLLSGQIDLEIKGIEKNNPWDSIRTLTLFLAGLH